MNEQSGQPPAGAGAGAGAPGEPTEAELQAALEEQMRNIRVEDVVVQTTVTLVNLGARRLGLAAAPGEDPGAQSLFQRGVCQAPLRDGLRPPFGLRAVID